jgi:RNA polymerase sigma-70 factor (ECF subfamily)
LHERSLPPDGELARRALAGEVEAFGVLVERYRVAFARYATGLCGDSDTAADAMQEAFIRAYNSLADCRDPNRFQAWFFRILTNQCHTARTRKRRHAPLEAVAAAADERTDERLERDEVRQAMDLALADLTREQREAFVLKHIEGHSYAEMSELLQEGVDALKMRVHRARDAVKRRLEGLL